MPIVLLILFCINFAHGADLKVKGAWGKTVDRCGVKDARAKVWVFKQWHLGPEVETQDVTAASQLPQYPNQHAIYMQLAAWAKAGDLRTVFAEGCEGEINKEFNTAFNGWDLAALNAAAEQKNFEKILTLVPLKLEARFGDQLQTWCADDTELIKTHNLAFSDARGLVGFMSRLEQFKDNPAKAAHYLDAATKLADLSADAPVVDVLQALRGKLKTKVEEIRRGFSDRNKKVVAAIEAHGGTRSALVLGGLHALDLKEKLIQAKVDCEIIEPKGYMKDDEKLLKDLEALLERP